MEVLGTHTDISSSIAVKNKRSTNLLVSAIGAATIFWDLWEISNALREKPTLIGNILGSVVAIPIYGSLAFGIMVFLVGWNYPSIKADFARKRASREKQRPENRFRGMESMLQAELGRIEREAIFPSLTISAAGYIDREAIKRALFALGIHAPDSNSSNQIYHQYLATIIPLAKAGEIESARRFSQQFVQKG